uniref:Uncharacterized protein n=1 Tax=Rhizophora mucronata TaxID=61149 RepID=A0A2P2IYS4_RHIMU
MFLNAAQFNAFSLHYLQYLLKIFIHIPNQKTRRSNNRLRNKRLAKPQFFISPNFHCQHPIIIPKNI